MAISVGGLMSGMDTESIINQLMAVERRPILQLQRKEADFQLKLSTYGSLQSALSDFNSSVEAMNKSDDFAKFEATSDDTDIFTASANDSAVIGSYNITVHNLAQVHKLTSNGFSEAESVGEGTLSIQMGSGTEITVDVTSGDTIQDVADAINAEDGDVTAGVIFDGTNYFLALTGSKTGEANSIKITVDDAGDGNDTDTNGLSRLAYEKGVTENQTESQTALDVTIDIDGVTGIKRASNTMDDVIEGVTIKLTAAHEDPLSESTKLTVGRDTAAIISKIDKFISAYNAVASSLQSNQSFDEASGTSGSLLGDSTAKLIQRRLSSSLTMDHPGMDTVSTLSDLGISRDVNGKLELKSSTLVEKLEEDFNSVVKFFTNTTNGEEGFALRMVDELDTVLDSTDGTLAARQKGIKSSIKDIGKSVERIEMRVAANESRMRMQFNALELLLNKYQATGNYLTQQLNSLSNLNTAISKR